MQYKFNISVAPPFDTFEAVEKGAKARLNYGWEFVELVETKNEDFPYRVTLNWKKDGIPYVPPYNDDLLHISSKQ